MSTPILGITELTSTSGERSTIVEGFRVLDAIWGNVDAANLNINTPPASPAEGDMVMIGASPTGAFAGFAGHLAIRTGTGWQFVAPDKLGAISTDSGFYVPNGTFTAWEPIPGSGLTSPLTTKGDIWTYSTSDDRLPVGADGQILAANSTTSTGLEWVDNTGGGGTIARTFDLVWQMDDLTEEKVSEYPRELFSKPRQ